MKEALLSPNQDPQVVIVAGMGCRTTSSIMLPMIEKEFENQSIRVDSVDGTFINNEGQLEVSPPSQQTKEISQIIESADNPSNILFVSHCLGALAVVDAIKSAEQTDFMRGLLIAPPLPTPAQTIESPRVQSKIFTDHEGKAFMKTADFPADDPYNFDKLAWKNALIKPKFLEEIEKSDLLEKARQLSSVEKIGLAIPTRDWNTAMIRATSNWPGQVLRLANAGHALNTEDGSIDAQQQICRDAVNFSLALRGSHIAVEAQPQLAA